MGCVKEEVGVLKSAVVEIQKDVYLRCDDYLKVSNPVGM